MRPRGQFIAIVVCLYESATLSACDRKIADLWLLLAAGGGTQQLLGVEGWQVLG